MPNLSQFAVPQKVTIPKGAYGVWQIPELNVEIPLYSAKNVPEAQKFVDKANAASIQKWGVGRVIADHQKSKAGSGVWDVSTIRPDMKAYMIKEKETLSYSCKFVARVKANPGGYVLDGQVLWPKKSTEIFCVSCANGSGTENYLASFKYDGKMP